MAMLVDAWDVEVLSLEGLDIELALLSTSLLFISEVSRLPPSVGNGQRRGVWVGRAVLWWMMQGIVNGCLAVGKKLFSI